MKLARALHFLVNRKRGYDIGAPTAFDLDVNWPKDTPWPTR